MSKLRVFSAFDTKIGSFISPFYMEHVGQALRFWEEIVSDPKSHVCKFPHDFILYEVANFDSETGLHQPISPPALIATAIEIKEKNSTKQGSLLSV